jgi:hypothetical protein
MINNDFQYDEEPWIVHTNLLDAEGNWTGQVGSWGGSYSVFDYVETRLDGSVIFSSDTEGDAPRAEHLLYQEWNPLQISTSPTSPSSGATGWKTGYTCARSSCPRAAAGPLSFGIIPLSNRIA